MITDDRPGRSRPDVLVTWKLDRRAMVSNDRCATRDIDAAGNATQIILRLAMVANNGAGSDYDSPWHLADIVLGLAMIADHRK